MFRNLVESGSHATDLKRRGSFFAGAVAFYAVLLTAAGVGSIYAINVRLDDREELELITLMNFPPQPASAEPEPRRPEPRPAAGGQHIQVARVTEVIRNTPYATEVARTNAPELPRHVPFVIDSVNSVPADIGPVGPRVSGVTGDGRNTTGPVVDSGGEIAPPARTPPKVEPPKQEPPRQQVVKLASSVITGKAVSKPTPVYPAVAKLARVQGTVPVQILIDESGRVIQAQATGGPQLLQKSAVDAAYRARFSPTLLSQMPVKVSGVIYYNFVLQ